MILIILSVFLLSMTTGCSLLQVKDPQREANQVYKKDLRVTVDGKEFIGVGVLPAKNVYKITVFPEGNVDRIIFQSCSREIVADRPKKDGWFRNSYTFTYDPMPYLETESECPLEIAVLEKKTIANGFAFFEIQDTREEYSVPAHLQCNGEYKVYDGVGICMGPAGLKQRIWFMERTILEGVSPRCASLETRDGFFYDITLSPSECSYVFVAKGKTKTGKRKAFRLSTIGYTALPNRME